MWETSVPVRKAIDTILAPIEGRSATPSAHETATAAKRPVPRPNILAMLLSLDIQGFPEKYLNAVSEVHRRFASL